MTWSSAAVLPELPAMSFCFKPCLKRKPRGIGLLFLLVRPLILLMETNSEIRRSIIPAASQSVRRLEAVYLESIASSPFISVRNPPPYKQAETKVGPQSFDSGLFKFVTHLLTRFPKIDHFGMGGFECSATRAPSRKCSRHRRRCLQAPQPRLGASSFATLPSQTHRLVRREPGRTP